jgi:hypothetical protein
MENRNDEPNICAKCPHRRDCQVIGQQEAAGRKIAGCLLLKEKRPPTAPVGSPKTFSQAPDDERRSQMTSRELGLCKDCDLRLTCKRPLLEGGIWHCKDYQ